MIFDKKGFVRNDLFVGGFAWSPAYILNCAYPVVFEAGFSCMGRHYERDIREALHGREPKILFLTHVHYDHCGSAAYLRRVFPDLRIAGSRRAAEIMKRPNARKLMTDLSENVFYLIEGMEGVDKDLLMREAFEPFVIDMPLGDGDVVDMGEGVTVRVIAAPGHTRDMLSYYVPEKKILIATESTGCMDNMGRIVTEFLVDYAEYINSLERLSLLDIEILCQGHHFVFTSEDVKRHFERSIQAAREFKDKVEYLLLREHGSVDRVVSSLKREEYDTNSGVKQPKTAYLINLKTRVAHLAERLFSNTQNS